MIVLMLAIHFSQNSDFVFPPRNENCEGGGVVP
jgi:hypothetical protein